MELTIPSCRDARVLSARRLWLAACLIVPIFVASVRAEVERGAGNGPVAAAERVSGPAAHRLEHVLDLVDRSNVPRLVGNARWRELVAAHRGGVERCTTHASFAEALNSLIRAAGVSHFKYLTEEDWTYWHLLSTFYRHDPDIAVDHIGVYPQRIGDHWFVRGIIEGGPAESCDLRVGDELLSVDGEPFTPVASFRAKAGHRVELRVCRRPGLTLAVAVTPVRETLYEVLQRASRTSVRVIEHGELKFAYLHGWTLLGGGSEYDALVRLQDEVDGLLLDYRDGFGGTWDAAASFLLGASHGGQRSGPRWKKPVVVLTGDGTRSAKEIVVDAAQTAGRALLVGEPSAGEVVSVGSVNRIGRDGLLLLPGERFSLEGKPTHPDYLMPRDIRYCGGEDDQLAFAKDLLAARIRGVEIGGLSLR